MDGCDDQLFPASFRALEHDLGFTPTNLGVCSLSQTMAFALFSPAWARLAEQYNRKWMLSAGCAMWGICTIALALASDFTIIVFFRFINGIALASIGPIATATLSEMSHENRRGFVFSLVQASKNTGRLIGGFVTTVFALQVFFGSIPGWRLAFLLVGVLSLLLSGVVLLVFDSAAKPPSTATNSLADHQSLMGRSPDRELEEADDSEVSPTPMRSRLSPDSTNPIPVLSENLYGALESPTYPNRHHADSSQTNCIMTDCGLTIPLTGPTPPVPDGFKSPWCASDLLDYFKLRSVVNLAIVELFIGIPWGALTFCTLWLQYMGMSDHNAAVIVSVQIIAIIFFSPIAGKLSDSVNAASSRQSAAASSLNANGRTLLAQISMAIRIPILLLLFIWAPGLLYDRSDASTSNIMVDAFVRPSSELEALVGVKSADPNDHVLLLSGLCVLSGMFAAMGGATNRPLITELVGPTYRTSTLAWIDCIEICIRAVMGAPLVGLLAEILFGFTPMPNVSISEMDPIIRRRNAFALGQALALCVVVPTFIALIAYSPLHYSLERDKGRAYLIFAKHQRKHWEALVIATREIHFREEGYVKIVTNERSEIRSNNSDNGNNKNSIHNNETVANQIANNANTYNSNDTAVVTKLSTPMRTPAEIAPSLPDIQLLSNSSSSNNLENDGSSGSRSSNPADNNRRQNRESNLLTPSIINLVREGRAQPILAAFLSNVSSSGSGGATDNGLEGEEWFEDCESEFEEETGALMAYNKNVSNKNPSDSNGN